SVAAADGPGGVAGSGGCSCAPDSVPARNRSSAHRAPGILEVESFCIAVLPLPRIVRVPLPVGMNGEIENRSQSHLVDVWHRSGGQVKEAVTRGCARDARGCQREPENGTGPARSHAERDRAGQRGGPTSLKP